MLKKLFNPSAVNHFALVLSALSLCACGVELQDKQNNPAPAVAPPSSSGKVQTFKSINESDIQVQVTGMEKVHSYSVMFSWAPTTGTLRIQEGSVLKGVVPGANGVFEQTNVKGGALLNYKIEHITDDGRIASTFPLTIEVPVDVELNGPIRLDKNTQIEGTRIFIGRDLTLYTFDKNLKLSAKEIIAEGGVIANFPPSTKAFRETNGRPGGNIQITAKNAKGSVKFILNGEDGGDGKHGVVTFPGAHPGCAGTNGAHGGNSGSLNLLIQNGKDLSVDLTRIAGQAGAGGRRGFLPYTATLDEAVHPPCRADAAEATNGSPGSLASTCVQLSTESQVQCQ